MPSLAPGVREIRIHAENEYRILYAAGVEEAFFVLHAFAKKMQKTPKRDLDLARERFDLVVKGRRS
jgi:phage-related protein